MVKLRDIVSTDWQSSEKIVSSLDNISTIDICYMVSVCREKFWGKAVHIADHVLWYCPF